MKKILSVVMALIMIMTIIPLSSISAIATETSTSGSCGESTTWTFDKATGTLTFSGTGDINRYEYDYRPWESYEDTIKKVVFENGITNVPAYVVAYCENVNSVSIGNTVKSIGEFAFAYCAFTSLSIPSSVREIGEGACCYVNELKNLTFANGITSVGENAFIGARFTTLNLPKSLSNIGEYAFLSDYITKITVDKNNSYFSSDEYGVLFNKDKTKLIQYPAGNTRTSYTIPNSVNTIDKGAFYDCKNLTDITIGNSVKKLEFASFAGCSGLTNIVIPNSVTTIGEDAFTSCENLESIVIGDGVTTIEMEAFDNCGKLANITIGDNVKSIGLYAFIETAFVENALSSFDENTEEAFIYLDDYLLFGYSSKSELVIEDGTKIIADGALSYSETMYTSIVFPESVINVGEFNFFISENLAKINVASENQHYYSDNYGVLYNKDKTQLVAYPRANTRTNYTVLSGVTDISGYAFGYCSNLSKVVLPDSLINIGECAFASCTNLTTITIPDSVINISGYAFCDCTNLTTITIPDSVTSIGEEAFLNCEKLSSVKIGSGLNKLEEEAFRGCDSITNITVDGNNEYFSSDEYGVLFNKDKTELIKYPVGHYRTTYTIPNGVKLINYYAFDYCDNLESITIPKSVTYVRSTAFEHCPNLTDVYYDGTEEEWKSVVIRSRNDALEEATVHTKQALALDNSEILAFGNNYSSFTNGFDNKYYIADNDFEKLCDYTKNLVSNSDYWINFFQQKRNSEWHGSCYGMSSVTLLDKYGYVDFNETFDSNAKTMNEVDKPVDNPKVRSAINYYQISYGLSSFYCNAECFEKKDSDWSAGLKRLVNEAKSGKGVMFNYWFNIPTGEQAGHAIIIKGYEEMANGDHKIITYDNRYPNKECSIIVDSKYKNCTVVGNPQFDEIPYMIEFFSDYSGFDKIDITGSPDKSKAKATGTSTSKVKAVQTTTLSFLANGSVYITNDEGETLTFKDGLFTGNMDVLSYNFTVNSTNDGEAAPYTVNVEVNNSKSYTFENDADELEVSVLSSTLYAYSKTNNADTIVIAEDEGIYILGKDFTYQANLSLNNQVCDMLAVSGESKSKTTIRFKGDGIVVDGSSGDSTVTVFSNVTNVESVAFTSEYEDIIIKGSESGTVGKVDVLASSEGNGKYDVTLVEENITVSNFHIQAPSRTEIRCKDGIVLHANVTGTLPEGAKIVWSTSNNKFKTKQIDADSFQIISNNDGYTTITASIVDADGNVLASDSIEMRSKAGFGDKIGGFFRSLFGATKIYDK